MCTSHTLLQHSRAWNWDGDRIVHEAVVHNARKQSVTHRLYDVDVREFLQTEDNTVLRKALSDIADGLKPRYRKVFLSREQGSFDIRVAVLKRYISEKVAYDFRPERFDTWLYPEETLSARSGDCEDRAFLLASLMIASGVSNYCVRVILGKVHVLPAGKTIDHAWVMYKDEAGMWQCIEPLDHTPRGSRGKPAREASYEYVPIFGVNNEHMWQIGGSGERNFGNFLRTRKTALKDTKSVLKTYRPSFGFPLHREIVSGAIDANEFDAKLTDAMRSELDWHPIPPDARQYLEDFSSMVARVDITLSYEPRLHFDNGLIEESQAMLVQNLRKGTLDGFAKACHATADFYSHTSYPYFAKKKAGDIVVATCVDPSDPAYAKQFETLPDYSQGDFALGRFSTNGHVWKDRDKSRAAQYLNGAIISGRFGQRWDSKVPLEYTQFYRAESDWQGALPHHEEIAVDSDARGSAHVLYPEAEYGRAYEQRRRAAIAATRALFAAWR